MTAVALELAPIDKTRALKALGFDPKLSPTAMRVGMLIVEHFNLKTGRCFPSWPRLMRILGIDRSTLARALKQLRQRGYLRHQRHAEKGGASAYDPNWQLFRQKAAEVEQAATSREGTPLNQVAKLTPERSQDCAKTGGETATQSLEGSLQKSLEESRGENSEPILIPDPPALRSKLSEFEGTGASSSPSPQPTRPPPRTFQPSFLLPIKGGEDSADVAARKVWKRIESAFMAHATDYNSPVYLRFQEVYTDQRQKEWTAAEMRKAGAGVAMARKLVMEVAHAA